VNVFTPEQMASALERFGKDAPREQINAIRRGLTFARGLVIAHIRRTGVGQALWGRKASGARLMVPRQRVTRSGNTIHGGLLLKGLAAMIETGGHTAPHAIAPKLKPALARALPGGGSFFSKTPVQHPGSRVPAQPSAQASMREALPRIAQEIDKGMQRLADRVIG
jgi:hypothetical protein